MHNDVDQKKAFIAYLQSRITENKWQKMQSVIEQRTKHVTVVLENLFQERNVSAIVRTAECLGIQDLHVIQDAYTCSITEGIAVGSSKWITMHHHENIAASYKALKEQGYRIVATTPHTQSCIIESLSLEGKLAFVFGTEETGLSPYALEHADEYVKIPMYGFTESFNVGISAALCMYDVAVRLRKSSIAWQLSEANRCDILLEWLKKNIRGFQEYERMFLESEAK